MRDDRMEGRPRIEGETGGGKSDHRGGKCTGRRLGHNGGRLRHRTGKFKCIGEKLIRAKRR